VKVHAAFDVDGYFAPTIGVSSLGFVPLKTPVSKAKLTMQKRRERWRRKKM
jgi:hypothetical protein